jgi:hypothetical protein
MKRMMGVLALIVSMALNACTSNGEQETNALREMNATVEQCDFSNDSRFVVLRGKMPLSAKANGALPTLAELSNSNRPTPTERQAIMDMDTAVQPCRTAGLELATRYNLPTTAALKRLASANLKLKAQLVAGEITYGQYRQRNYDNQQATTRENAEAQPVTTSSSGMRNSDGTTAVQGRGCLHQTLDKCLAYLRPHLDQTGYELALREVERNKATDVNGKRIAKKTSIITFLSMPEALPSQQQMIQINYSDSNEVTEVEVWLRSNPSSANTDDEYTKTGLYEAATLGPVIN